MSSNDLILEDTIDELIPRTVKCGRDRDYRLMVYISEVTPEDKVSLTFVSRNKKTWEKIHDDILCSDKCLCLANDLPIAKSNLNELFDRIRKLFDEDKIAIVNETISIDRRYINLIIQITMTLLMSRNE